MNKLVLILALNPILMYLADNDVKSLLNSMKQVESNGNINAVGDGGKSLGILQIQKEYYEDAISYGLKHKLINGVPNYKEGVKSEFVSEVVTILYWMRYCPKALENKDLEKLARIHNGGPKGRKKKATLPYWEKVRKGMK